MLPSGHVYITSSNSSVFDGFSDPDIIEVGVELVPELLDTYIGTWACINHADYENSVTLSDVEATLRKADGNYNITLLHPDLPREYYSINSITFEMEKDGCEICYSGVGRMKGHEVDIVIYWEGKRNVMKFGDKSINGYSIVFDSVR